MRRLGLLLTVVALLTPLVLVTASPAQVLEVKGPKNQLILPKDKIAPTIESAKERDLDAQIDKLAFQIAETCLVGAELGFREARSLLVVLHSKEMRVKVWRKEKFGRSFQLLFTDKGASQKIFIYEFNESIPVAYRPEIGLVVQDGYWPTARYNHLYCFDLDMNKEFSAKERLTLKASFRDILAEIIKTPQYSRFAEAVKKAMPKPKPEERTAQEKAIKNVKGLFD